MSTVPATGLTLVLGPANSGKLGRVLDWWIARLESHPLIVVPTGPDARSLSSEMAERLGALVGQAPAVTFDGLVRLLLNRSPRYAADFERSLLVSHILRERPPQAPGFSARFPGTVNVVASLLEQLGDSGRPPEKIDLALRRWAAEDAASTPVAADIRELLTGYRALRDSLGLTDRADAIREALDFVPSWSRPVAFYGFTSFTLAQRELVAGLARSAEVLLVFDYERSRGRGLTTPDELAWWESLSCRVVELEARQLAYNSPAIAYLERHFMDDHPPAQLPPEMSDRGGVRFLLASGQRNEVELAAEQIAGLIRGGLRPGRIALVVRHMPGWAGVVAEVLASCGIPCQVDEHSALAATAIGHAFIVGLRGVAEDDGDGVLQYLRSPFSGVDPERVSDLHLTYARQTARGLDALEACAGPGVREALAELARPIVLTAEGVMVDPDAADALVRRMLENTLRRMAPGASSSARLAGDARAVRALAGSLSRLSVHSRSGSLPAGVLRADVLLPALAGTAVPGGPLGSDEAVQVLTAHRARARRFDALVVLGLVEGEFPGRPQRPALLTEAQRERLDALAGGLFSPQADQEEALFVRAVSRAWTFLFLSSRDADDGGGFAGQSYYWSHCKELLGVADEEVLRRTLADQGFDMAIAPTPRQYLRACAIAGTEPHPASQQPQPSFPQWRGRSEALLRSEQVLSHLAATPTFSPSALESYLTCPFKWFVENVVGMEEMEPVMDRQLVGKFLHKVLSETYRELASAGRLPPRGEDVQYAEAAAGAVIAGLIDGDECPGTRSERRLAGHQLKRMVSDLFAMEVAAGASRTLEGTELSIGGKSGVEVGGLALRGRIDRVDATAAGELFIIDYKSGGVPEKRKIGTAEGLQLPLYMLALAEERPERRVVGGEYLSAGRMERSGVLVAGCEGVSGAEARSCRLVGDGELEQLLDETLELARQAAEGIKSGRISPRTDRACPDWCRLGPVCRSRRAGGRRRR